MKTIVLILAAFIATPLLAAESRYIVDISVGSVYVYDDAGDELGELRAAALKKQFAAIPGGEQSGIAVLTEDAAEGLLQVQLAEYPQPVWVETMAVKLWPSERLQCPEVTTGRAEVAQSGMTIGFGEHCEPQGE
jgi:hypothetical protein